MNPSPHGAGAPSAWVQRWTPLINPQGQVLDLACGQGRHMRWLQSQGLQCLGVDRDPVALQAAQAFGEVLLADLENQAWPLSKPFDAVVITHYLWRALWPSILASLKPGGVLIYETFAKGNETVGKPSNPAFLLQPGELLERCQGLRVVAFEDGFLPDPDRFIQRIAAVKPQAQTTSTVAFPLSR
ncbi:MAG: class I SAM-dependent methyltransferase [Betaproteobacteria bacterium]|nr:class I SAM-dependent methyltransferase [Betaproteobacteria bacterium]